MINGYRNLRGYEFLDIKTAPYNIKRRLNIFRNQ